SPPAPFCLPFSSRHAPPLTAIYTLSLTRRSSDLDLQLAGLLGGIDQLARDGLRTRDDEAGIGIEQAALHLVFLDQREHFLDLGRRDRAGARAEGAGGGKLALDLLHPRVIARAGDFEAADAGVVAHLLVEIDGILG